MKTVKKYSLTALIAALAIAAAMIPAVCAAPIYDVWAAQSTMIKAHLVSAGESGYFYTRNVTDLFADESNLYAAEADTLHKFTHSGEYLDGIAATPDAQKYAVCSGKIFVLKSDGTVEVSADITLDKVSDIYASGSKLYVLDESGITVYDVSADGGADTVNVRTLTVQTDAEKKYLAACSPEEIFVCTDAGANTCDILRITADGADKVYSRMYGIKGFVSPAPSSVAILQPTGISLYEIKNGMLRRAASDTASGVEALSAGGGSIFALCGEGRIVKYDASLAKTEQIAASASDEDGFFRMPHGVSTRKDYMLVADYGNNRVAKITSVKSEDVRKDKVSYIDYAFSQPTAAVTDFLGNSYVSHDMDRIEVFDGDGRHLRTVKTEGAVIDDMKFDALGNLYILSRGSVMKIAADSLSDDSPEAAEVARGNYISIAVAPSQTDEIYALDAEEKSVMRLRGNDNSAKLFSFGKDAVSLTADLDKNIYLLTADGRITKYSAEANYAESAAVSHEYESGYEIGAGAGYITLSLISNGIFSYGDIIVADPVRHCVKRIAAADYGVKAVDESFVPPEIGNDANDIVNVSGDRGRIIRTANFDLDIFERPMESTPLYTAEKGRNIIVIEYDTGVSAFARIGVDDVQTHRFVTGYVYKSLLSEALKYDAAPAKTATVFSSTPVYKYPSQNSPVLTGYEGYNDKTHAAAKDSAFAMLSFVSGYTDEYPNTGVWYRIKVADGKEGYIRSINVSVRGYLPDDIRPQTNAVILSVNGSTGTLVYLKNEKGEFVAADEYDTLPTGKRVEVIGAFDSSKEFTLVRCYNEGLGTLEGYVRTEYIKYDGLGVLPVIIVILVILATAGIISFFVWRKAAEKRKLTKA